MLRNPDYLEVATPLPFARFLDRFAVSKRQPAVDAAEDSFRDAESGIAALVQTLGGNDLDHPGFIFKDTTDQIHTETHILAVC